MKFKYLFLSLMILIMVGSIAAISAEDDYASLGDYTFDIPDGYEIVNETDDTISMQEDTDHAIVISMPPTVKTPDEFKAQLEDQGYKFGDEDTYEVNNFEIDQYNYEYGDYQGFLYICDDGNDSPILITLVIPGDEDVPSEDDNPVTQVVNSLE